MSSCVIFSDDLNLYASASHQTLDTVPSAISGMQSDTDLLISTASWCFLHMNENKWAVLHFS